MIFCYFREWSCIFLGSHIFARHLASLIHQSAVPYGRFAFLHFFQKSCSKCFKKRFKSRSRWMLILGLNPSFGGFFSQNFQKLKITKFKTPGRKRTRGHVRSHPQKSITFAGGGGRRRREGGREGGRRTWVFIAPSKNGALRAKMKLTLKFSSVW